MVQDVRAIYEGGRLRPLDPVALAEGEQVRLTILSQRERVRAARGDVLAAPALEATDARDDAASLAQAEIDAAWTAMAAGGHAPASEAIMQERRYGP